MAQNGQIHDFHGKKGQKVKKINAIMPKNDKCAVTACIYIKFDRMNNLPARGVEGLPIEGDRMDQNHQIGKDERLWIQTHSLAKMFGGINCVYTDGEGLRGWCFQAFLKENPWLDTKPFHFVSFFS